MQATPTAAKPAAAAAAAKPATGYSAQHAKAAGGSSVGTVARVGGDDPHTGLPPPPEEAEAKDAHVHALLKQVEILQHHLATAQGELEGSRAAAEELRSQLAAVTGKLEELTAENGRKDEINGRLLAKVEELGQVRRSSPEPVPPDSGSASPTPAPSRTRVAATAAAATAAFRCRSSCPPTRSCWTRRPP